MTFLWPVMFGLLALIPLFVGIYIRIHRRRQRLAANYGSLGLLQAGLGRGPGLRRHIPPAFFLAGLAILIVALTRPQMEIRIPRVEGKIILAFDVSGSMAAEDMPPNRMEAAKVAALRFVERQPSSVLVGVVAFSDSGFSIQPPTADQDAILTAISRLTPERGTSLGHGIVASLNAISMDAGGKPLELSEEPVLPQGSFPSSIIVLLTDGENNEPPDPFAAAQAAQELDVRIFPIGIGSPAGAPLEIEGFTVYTRLDEEMLRQIARISGGDYYIAQTEEDLRAIYDDVQPQLVVKSEYLEITSIFAGIGILVLLIGSALSLAWFGRVP